MLVCPLKVTTTLCNQIIVYNVLAKFAYDFLPSLLEPTHSIRCYSTFTLGDRDTPVKNHEVVFHVLRKQAADYVKVLEKFLTSHLTAVKFTLGK